MNFLLVRSHPDLFINPVAYTKGGRVNLLGTSPLFSTPHLPGEFLILQNCTGKITELLFKGKKK